MSNIRLTILQGLFNIPEPNSVPENSGILNAAFAEGSTKSNDLHSHKSTNEQLSGLLLDLRAIAERLDIICASSFNVSTLSFLASSQAIPFGNPPTISDCEGFLATLVPTAPSSRLFVHKIRSLQALTVDLEGLRVECLTSHDNPDFVSECDNIFDCITSDFQKLLSSAWKVAQEYGRIDSTLISAGVHRFDYCTLFAFSGTDNYLLYNWALSSTPEYRPPPHTYHHYVYNTRNNYPLLYGPGTQKLRLHFAVSARHSVDGSSNARHTSCILDVEYSEDPHYS